MIKLPIVKQNKEYNCAEACVRSVLDYYSINYKHILFASSIDGAAPRTIEHIFRKSKLNVLAGNMDFNGVKYYIKRKLPIITCFDSHYVVLVDIDDKKLIYMDPMCDEYQTISIRKFKTNWQDVDTVGTHYNHWCIIASVD